jgi:hypothetical protein
VNFISYLSVKFGRNNHKFSSVCSAQPFLKLNKTYRRFASPLPPPPINIVINTKLHFSSCAIFIVSQIFEQVDENFLVIWSVWLGLPTVWWEPSVDKFLEDLGILSIAMATIVTLVTIFVTASLMRGAATTAQATTEELLTELDKPSEYFILQTSDKVSYLVAKILLLHNTLVIYTLRVLTC